MVLCNTKEESESAKNRLTQWLAKRGLQLSDEKTKIVNVYEGFDFLGFSVRCYTNRRTKRGFKTIIKPSQESILKIKQKLREKWKSLQGHDVKLIVKELNPIIRGWANYYRGVIAKEIFAKLDQFMFTRELQYAKKKHPRKSWKWRKAKYWGKLNPDHNGRWIFGDTKPPKWNLLYNEDEIHCPHLLKFAWTKIQRHILVKGRSSPDDPKLKEYWVKRNSKGANNLIKSYQKLAKRQNDKCPICGESLFNDEAIQKHHIVPKSKGGENTYSNLQFVHYLCHQQIHGS